ncbi:hypothetical protein PPSIR1_10330 [Plesiocystis pacifica SIR-1]|uniref:Cytochrome c-type biogenesis protein n=1 Tax=Plesiocystis pacifica SIR-1 TaxID=391625 RepID=A6GFG8_9BACT|nr:cytochrome c-type biogenesis protein CcmH [Plesiocystis pacifica]EDM75395.1 hypothetical protein PPSIR1_10330 [Plesiocystis pacifica SIR-1]
MSSPAQPSANDLQAEAVARDIASDMPSPYCPGRSIASCPSQAARELEDDILELAKDGKEKGEIEAILVQRFGEDKMGSSSQGEILAAVVLGTVLALVAIVLLARRWMQPADAAAGVASGGAVKAKTKASAGLDGVSVDELDRLEDALDELDEL